MALAKIIGMFRLTRDAELKYAQSGSAILKMGLACSEKFGDKETQLFIDATVFGKQAEIISQYAGEKGTQIFLTGKLQTESWEKDGVKQYKTSMIVESFDFVSKPKGDNESKPYTPPTPTYEQKPMPQSSLPELEADLEIPF
jgi:single-strand DNA-binding protein